ncbi:hypothetical protein FB645_005922 [Coemansia sp. IMI 203386]|nr:hypothetical protein FB645_005922 [Coemansia sp. IMI 203386]
MSKALRMATAATVSAVGSEPCSSTVSRGSALSAAPPVVGGPRDVREHKAAGSQEKSGRLVLRHPPGAAKDSAQRSAHGLGQKRNAAWVARAEGVEAQCVVRLLPCMGMRGRGRRGGGVRNKRWPANNGAKPNKRDRENRAVDAALCIRAKQDNWTLTIPERIPNSAAMGK